MGRGPEATAQLLADSHRHLPALQVNHLRSSSRNSTKWLQLPLTSWDVSTTQLSSVSPESCDRCDWCYFMPPGCRMVCYTALCFQNHDRYYSLVFGNGNFEFLGILANSWNYELFLILSTFFIIFTHIMDSFKVLIRNIKFSSIF